MDEGERYHGMTTQQAVIVALTKLDGLTEKVDQALNDFKAEKDERTASCIAEGRRLNKLDNRVTTVETYWKVVIGILVVIVPTLGVIIWDILR
jgi:hypothetical protein